MSVRYVYANLLEKLAELLKVTEQVALFLLIGCGALLVLIIALVVILIVVGNKKKKAKLIKQEVVVNQEKELEEVKEVEPETTSVEETPVEEATPVVEEIPVEEVEEEAVETKSVRVSIGKFEVFPVNDVFLYRLKASNGEILVTSEIYKTLKGAIAAVDTVKKNIETGTLSIYEDKHGLWQFKLFAVNKRLLVASANYQTQARCESAANSFKKFALVSPVVELEEDPEHLMEELQIEVVDKKGGKISINALEDAYEFKLLASNGVVLCTSIDYKTKAAITNGINVLKEAVKNGKFFVVKDKRGTYQFKLYSSLGRFVLAGEAYKSKAQAISSANSVANFINLAEIIDNTVKVEAK